MSAKTKNQAPDASDSSAFVAPRSEISHEGAIELRQDVRDRERCNTGH
jgi:hypothetical protein